MQHPKSIFTGNIDNTIRRSATSPSTPRPSTQILSISALLEPISSISSAEKEATPAARSAPKCPVLLRNRYTWLANDSIPQTGHSVRSTFSSTNTTLIASPPHSPSSARKRPLETKLCSGPVPHPSVEPDQKKARTCPKPRHTLDYFSFPGPSIPQPEEPQSPLFFSNSPRSRPLLNPGLTSSEAAVKMLSKARGEDGGIRTVHLARGTLRDIGRSTSEGHNSVERPGVLRSTSQESGQMTESLRILSQLGIMELLDQDERPTFLIDLADVSNATPGPLGIVWANSALHSHVGLLDLATGRTVDHFEQPSHQTRFQQFKAWMLSGVKNGESLDVCLPRFLHAGLYWSCSTIRKRLRVISGIITSESQLNSHVVASGTDTTSDAMSRIQKFKQMQRSDKTLPPRENEAAQDCFGALTTPNTPVMTGLKTDVHPRVDTQKVSRSMRGPGVSTQHQAAFTGLEIGENGRGVSDLDSSASLSGEAMLGATAAGNVDAFGPSPQTWSQDEAGFFDWTRLPLSDALPKHIQFARSVDWASTSLGPIESWSNDLRQMCNLIMASPHPAAMYWGDDLVAIYNEAYVLLAGQKHPRLMGQRYSEAWAEIWDDIKEVFANARQTGQATMKDDDRLFIMRNDFLEETYFSWSIIPMVGGEGKVMGLYNPAFEKTRRKIAERRMLTLREIGERTAAARDVKSFWAQVLAALDSNESDTPFVLLYSVSDESDSDSVSVQSSSVIGNKQCYLEGTLGVPVGHPSAPQQIELKGGDEGLGPVLREVMKTDKPVVLEVGSGELPASMVEGLTWRGFGDPCTSVVVCPIHPTTGEAILGFLVLGVNPRRPYDDDYSLFVQLLSRQLATSLASIILFEEEIKRGQRAAKLAMIDRMDLSEKLALRTQEAIESETKFTRMAEFAPVGMFTADSQGTITYCNDTWYEISRIPKEVGSMNKWIDYVKEEDQGHVHQLMDDLITHGKATTTEFRFKAPWEDRNGGRGDTWILFSAYPEKYDDGSLKSIFGSITNISPQKWAESWQKKKMEEAVELKRQQENFIDITSHEMRNPLSAILQCADEIATTMAAVKKGQTNNISQDVVTSAIDAAQTITLCAQHQKRIVDDILTLSKLDSALLMVTPVDVQPLAVVQRALKMFEGELQSADIQMRFVVEASFSKLHIDWVRFDPSRVLQVLINLTTNAIKFTTNESKRIITVSIGASTEKPSATGQNSHFNYIPGRSKRLDMTEGPDWGDGERVYIQFSVQDTGRGLTEDEKKMLFLRFSQASPRTHVTYGGSGLGLFISRELTELQGGEIGVASEAGKGSTFAFFVKARRSTAPTDANVIPAPAAKRVDGKEKTVGAAPPKSKDFAQKEKPSPAPSEPHRVLIVEDNLVNQRVLQKQLKNIGCIVHVANHGGEALDRLRESTFWNGNQSKAGALDISVVLMDQEMPVMDGLTCTRKIRELEKSGTLVRHVPIIAVTANARTEQIDTAMAAGMDDVVSKPFRIPDLIPKIEELTAGEKAAEPALQDNGCDGGIG